MKTVSIEQLVVWAYRDQMVHAARSEFIPAEASISFSPKLAAGDMSRDKVDSSVRAEFSAHHDAYRVHDAVKALGTAVRRRSDEEIGVILARRMNADLLLGYERRALGVPADLRSRNLFTGEVEIAPVIIDPLRETPLRRTQLVVEWAMRGKRPDWIKDPHYGWERGRAVYQHGADRKTATRHKVLFVQVNPNGDDPFEVEQARAVYSQWVRCLVEVRDTLDGELQNHRLNNVLPDAEPWKFSGNS